MNEITSAPSITYRYSGGASIIKIRLQGPPDRFGYAPAYSIPTGWMPGGIMADIWYTHFAQG